MFYNKISTYRPKILTQDNRCQSQLSRHAFSTAAHHKRCDEEREQEHVDDLDTVRSALCRYDNVETKDDEDPVFTQRLVRLVSDHGDVRCCFFDWRFRLKQTETQEVKSKFFLPSPRCYTSNYN